MHFLVAACFMKSNMSSWIVKDLVKFFKRLPCFKRFYLWERDYLDGRRDKEGLQCICEDLGEFAARMWVFDIAVEHLCSKFFEKWHHCYVRDHQQQPIQIESLRNRHQYFEVFSQIDVKIDKSTDQDAQPQSAPQFNDCQNSLALAQKMEQIVLKNPRIMKDMTFTIGFCPPRRLSSSECPPSYCRKMNPKGCVSYDYEAALERKMGGQAFEDIKLE